MTNTYLDNTGLFRKYGTAKATAHIAGELHPVSDVHQVVIRLDLTTLTETETIIDDVVVIPKGARIKDIEIVTHTAAATGTAIDLGLIKTDRTTEIDYNGLLAAYPTASMDAAGEETTQSSGTTYAGALIGTDTAYVGQISASRTTATAFTAGIVHISIRYYMPQT